MSNNSINMTGQNTNIIFKFINYNGNIILFLILKIAFIYSIPTQYDTVLTVKTICIF